MKLSEAEKQQRRDYYQANKQKFIDKAKAWKAANPEKVRESARKAQNKLNSEMSRQERKNRYLLQTYQLSLEEYTEMYNLQHGSCKICKKSVDYQNEKEGCKTANVDHCHDSGAVRGLLCNNCNRGLGYFKDSSTLLRLAAEYLDAFE